MAKAGSWDDILGTAPPARPAESTEQPALPTDQSWDDLLNEPTATPELPTTPTGGMWSGARPGLDLEDITSGLRVGEFAVGGLLSRQPGEGVLGAAVRGIRTKHGSQAEFERYLAEAGVPPHLLRKASAFALSMVVDPINVLPFGKAFQAAGKGLKIAGKVTGTTGAVVKLAEGLAPELVSRARYAEKLRPVMEGQVLRETKGVKRARGIFDNMREDAVARTPNIKQADELDRGLGMYFNVGQDVMMDTLAKTGDLPQARTLGFAAMDRFKAALPRPVQEFIEHWAPKIDLDEAETGRKLVLAGILKPEDLAKWEGLHLRRIYLKFQKPEEYMEFLRTFDQIGAQEIASRMARATPFPGPGRPIPTGVAKERKLLSGRERARLGEIESASNRYLAGQALSEQAIARGFVYKHVNGKYGLSAEDIMQRGLNPRDYFEMPTTGGWGALSGRWVPKQVHNILMDAYNTKEPVKALKVLAKLTGWWKLGKVVYNPASHMRNMRTNLSLMHNSLGLGALNPGLHMRAFKDLINKGPRWVEAQRVSTMWDDTWTAIEAKQLTTKSIATERQAWGGIWKNTFGRMERAYDFEEQWAKMTMYMAGREKGLSIKASTALAESALFNYRKVPAAVNVARRYGIFPFITFPYKVATQTIPSALKKPGRFSQQAKLLEALGEPLTSEERRSLPAHMRTGGYLKLPSFFKIGGKPVLWDLNYELAYGDLGDTNNPMMALLNVIQSAKTGKMDKVAKGFMQMMTPFGQLAAELLLNKSAFTGRPIVPEGETPKAARAMQLQHIIRGLTPSIAGKMLPPSPYAPGGELARSMAGALPGGSTGLTRTGEEPLPIGAALLSGFGGVRTQSYDVDKQTLFRTMELERLQHDFEARVRSIMLDQSLNEVPGAREERIQELQRRFMAAIRRYEQTGTVE